MRLLRILFLAVALALVLAAGLFAAMLSPRLQTWFVRRELERADPGSTVGGVAIGLSGAEVTDLTLRRGGAVLALPSLRAEFPPLAAMLDHRLLIGTLVAKGWTLDLRHLSRTQAQAWLAPAPDRTGTAGPRSFSFLSSAEAEEPLPAPAPFRGIFERVRLPFDLALGSADLEGEILLPAGLGAGPARVQVAAGGGGLGAGREGRFVFNAEATPDAAGAVSRVSAQGALTAEMDSPRTFTRASIRMNAVAYGAKFASGVRAVAEVGAQRSADGESYSIVLSSQTKPLLAVLADVPYDGERPSGTWRLDIADEDLSPFLLGRELPSFGVAGQGQVDADPRGADVHVTGALRGTCDRLDVFRPELAAIGAVGVLADFDVTRRGSLWRVDRISAAVQSTGPILNLRSLQPFAFDARTGAFQVADVTGDLFSVNLVAVPAAWLQVLAPDLVLAGGPLHGSFVGSAGPGGLSLRTIEPLVLEDATLGSFGHNIVTGLDLQSAAQGTYAPAGWQVDLSDLHVRAAQGELAAGSLRVGRRRALGEPAKIESSLQLQLAALLNRPGLAAPLGTGQARLDWSAVWGRERVVQASLVVTGVTNAAAHAPPVPDLRADVRADWQPDGVIAIHAPFTLSSAGRPSSELTFDGGIGWGLSGPAVQGTLAGPRLNAEDVAGLVALIGGSGGQPGLARAVSALQGSLHWTGDLKLALESASWRRIAGSGLAGELRFFADGISLDRLSGRLLGTAPFTASAALTVADASNPSATWHAHLEVQDLEAEALLSAIGVAHANIIEGRFRGSAECTGHGDRPSAAIAATDAKIDLTSTGGHFKLLATEVTPKTVAGNLALDALRTVANTFESVIKRHKSEFASSVDATLYAAKAVSDIGYDQLSVRITRSPEGDVWCREFALIAPEARLQGQALVSNEPGAKFANEPLDATLELRARGKLADALKYLDVLDPKPDDLGYRLCPLPISVRGTLHHPDTSALKAILLKLLEGKGSDLLNSAVGK